MLARRLSVSDGSTAARTRTAGASYLGGGFSFIFYPVLSLRYSVEIASVRLVKLWTRRVHIS